MREIYSGPDSAKVGFYKSVLEEAGILAFIRNDGASRGEAVATFLYPTLCITDDERYDEAMAMLKDLHDPKPIVGPDWSCPKCKEAVPASFDSCWNCQTPKPEM